MSLPTRFPRILRAPSPVSGTCQCYYECRTCGPPATDGGGADVCCGYHCYCGRGVPGTVAKAMAQSLARQNTVAAYPGPCTQVCDSGKPPVCSWFCRSAPESVRLHPLPSGGSPFVLRSY